MDRLQGELALGVLAGIGVVRLVLGGHGAFPKG
jgi:hypothetical protein